MKIVAMKIVDEINKAVDEFYPLFDNLTTSDLQGVAEARAVSIIRKHNLSNNNFLAMELSEAILEKLYECVRWGGFNVPPSKGGGRYKGMKE